MHEFSICQELVKTVLSVLEEQCRSRGRLLKVRVRAGALRQIVPDNMELAYSALTKGTPAEGSALEIRTAPITARCKSCGWTGEVQGIEFLCGNCGLANIEITGGKELCLETMEMEENDDD